MDAVSQILMIISGIGVFNSLFFILFILTEKKGNQYLNRLFSIVILFFTLRIATSVVFYFSETLADFIPNIGFAAFFCIGPSIYIYFRNSFSDNQKLNYFQLIHYLPALFLLIYSFIIEYSPCNLWWNVGCSLNVIHFFVYWVLSGFLLYKFNKDNQNQTKQIPKQNWYLSLYIFFGLIWLAYFLHYPIKLGHYINGALVYSITIYFIMYQWFNLKRKNKLPHDKISVISTQLNQPKIAEIDKKIQKLIDSEKVYKSPDLTMPQLAKLLGIYPYQLSNFINNHYQKNFNDFINYFRIEEAKQMMIQDKDQKLTITHIAYEVGFNSISSFNYAFKKNEKQTPSAYWKSLK